MQTRMRLVLVVWWVIVSGCSPDRGAGTKACKLPPDLAAALAANDIEVAVDVLSQTTRLNDATLGVLEAKARSEDNLAAFVGVTLLGRAQNGGQYRVLQGIAAKSADKLLRCQAMYSMGLLQDPRAAPFLLEVLACTQRDDYERWTAAAALGFIRDGIIDSKPLYVVWYVLIPNPEAESSQIWPLKLPTLDDQVVEFTEWWQANGKRLLQQQGSPAGGASAPRPKCSRGARLGEHAP